MIVLCCSTCVSDLDTPVDREEIRAATSSMTSVPKPLKFLRPHYQGLKDFFSSMMDSENKTLLADVLSVLGMTMAG